MDADDDWVPNGPSSAPGKARVDHSPPAFTALTRGALWFLGKTSNVAQTVKELNKAHKAFKSAHGGGWRVWNDPSLSGNHTLGARLARKYLEDFVVNGDDQHDAVFRPTLAFLQRDEASTPAAGNSARRSIDMTPQTPPGMTVFVLPAEALAWMSGRLEAWGGVKEDLDAETFLDDAYIGTVGRRWSGDVDEAVRSFFRGQHELLRADAELEWMQERQQLVQAAAESGRAALGSTLLAAAGAALPAWASAKGPALIAPPHALPGSLASVSGAASMILAMGGGTADLTRSRQCSLPVPFTPPPPRVRIHHPHHPLRRVPSAAARTARATAAVAARSKKARPARLGARHTRRRRYTRRRGCQATRVPRRLLVARWVTGRGRAC